MANRPTTPPLLQGPTAKEKKYDRQLRLWAASGQQALEDAHVLLLNSSPGVVGIETLKNLILPGVGNFTIVDEEKVREEDLGINFFLAEESLGKSRADESCRFLQELNPEVQGHAIQESLEDFIEQTDVLDKYSLILLIGPTPSAVLEKVCKYALKRSIPLFYIHSIGFYSQFSVQLPALFPIVDTHPDPVSTQDLRLLDPWPGLVDFVNLKTENLEGLNDHDHGHVPYLVLLLYYLGKWKASHDGKPPENYKEKTLFRDMVKDGARRQNAEGGEENFDEAVGAVLKSLNPFSISSGLREVLEAEECKSLHPNSKNFWIIAHAIGDFYSSSGHLPLPGGLPDMKAQSADYIQLQNTYKAKARKDLTQVLETVRSSEKQLGRKSAIDEKEVEAFCKGAAFVKLVKGRPLRIAEEPSLAAWSDRFKDVCREVKNEESLMPIYISFLAYDWYLMYNHFPPRPYDESPEVESAYRAQVTKLMTGYSERFLELFRKALGESNLDSTKERIRNTIAELGRAGGAELHNISALTGGMVAQEVIKVITKQYIPIDNTCIFDGITSKTAVLNL